jgi:hypothetical protein
MAKVKDQLAQYERLIATAVAQLLTMHPDFGPGQARRRARKVVGAKPAKKMLVKPRMVGVKEGLEMVAAAAASGAALKVAGKLGRKVTDRVKEAVEHGEEANATRDVSYKKRGG